MDRDTAIYLAQKAGISPEWIPIAPALPDFLERFAALCEAHGYQKWVAAFHEAVKMEREACKTACKACENGDPTDGTTVEYLPACAPLVSALT